MFALFLLIYTFVPADAAINGVEGIKHTHSVWIDEFATQEECEAAIEDILVLTYPGLHDVHGAICVQGWIK